MKMKGKIQIRAQSKREPRIYRNNLSPNKECSEDGLDNVTQKAIYKKIELDINSRRFGGHKKDFFVFGLSEVVGKSS
jgi:hypothetical protein